MNMRKLIIATAIGAGAMFGAVGTAVHAAEGDTNKQSVSEYASDTVITTKVKGALVADSTLSALDIAVETTDGTVVLSGTVGTEAEVEQAARVARDVEGVKQVQNGIKVDPSKAEKK
ncbi:BON domain-containing protein [Bordetella muralis]|jgi:hyperosmotically inducible periplasmic protein|uniref:BON domain-containing protein n=1 Tax=Bordetella muralis TaxID=1649130 RepID=UPI0039EF14A7